MNAAPPGAHGGHQRRLCKQQRLRRSRTHYDTTGQEILDDIGPVDYLIGGPGTTGSPGGRPCGCARPIRTCR